MSSPTDGAPPAAAPPASLDLDLDRVRYGDPAQMPAVTCAACKQPIETEYFEINGKTACQRCKDAIESRFQSGSGIARFLRATAGGVVAAVAGAVLYYAIVKLTGYEIGLVAIVLGFMVGRAVRWGARSRGGWLYQTLAVVLTYVSIAGAHAPFVWEAMMDAWKKDTAASASPSPASDPATPDPAAPNEAAPPAAPAAPAPQDDHPVIRALVAVPLVFVLSLAAPVLNAIHGEALITLLIIGFALYEAWRVNKRVELTFSGPYQVGSEHQPAGAPPFAPA